MKNNGKGSITSKNEKPQTANVLTIAKDAPSAEPTAETAEDLEQAKADAKAEIQKFEPIKNEVRAIVQTLKPSAEERIKNIENFKILSTRYSFLKQKADDLKRFKVENSGTNAKLILKNQSGFEFEVSNSSVISKALEKITEELNILLLDTENEVLNYEI